MKINPFTQISNIFIDNMNKYSGSAVKIFLAINRKTIGWHKFKDRISQSQLKKITGLSKNSIKKGIKELINNNWIEQRKSKLGYIYINKKINTFYYQELLKNKKWIDKSLEIKKRDNFQCVECKSKKKLQVHHIKYESFIPWETSNKFLITLCKKCHNNHHNKKE